MARTVWSCVASSGVGSVRRTRLPVLQRIADVARAEPRREVPRPRRAMAPRVQCPLFPRHVRPYANAKVWWLGPCGHSWFAVVASRTRGLGCPYCRGTLVAPENSFAARFPELAAQWHGLNGDLRPGGFMPGSKAKVWWLGPCGHTWCASIKSRVDGNGSGFCSGHSILPERSLAAKFPKLAGELHPDLTKTGGRRADQISPGTHLKVWWRGSCGHEWDAPVKNRTIRGDGCPVCSGRRVLFDDSVAGRFPEIASQWHQARNGNRRPETTAASYRRKLWWQGLCGHEWQATIQRRTARAAGCPSCK